MKQLASYMQCLVTSPSNYHTSTKLDSDSLVTLFTTKSTPLPVFPFPMNGTPIYPIIQSKI